MRFEGEKREAERQAIERKVLELGGRVEGHLVDLPGLERDLAEVVDFFAALPPVTQRASRGEF